jgi:Streptomycin adenylyltransferase
MIVQPGWQATAIHDLTCLLQPDPEVLALALFGSALQPEADLWSDLDLLLVVEERAQERFHPATDWLAPLGELYTWDQSSSPFVSVTRACFRDFRRLDFLIATEPALEQIGDGPPFWKGTHTLFSRSPRVDRVLARAFTCPPPGLMTAEQFQERVNGFWFKGMLAVTKVMREDLLIALHLALEMVQDCCVLGMLLRDRAEGTAHHRHGGAGNEVVRQLEAVRHSHTAAGILDCLEQAAVAFDDLAGRWSKSDAAQRQPLCSWIQLARQLLATREQDR